ncbi:MAG TPA: hypothetical protein ENF94_01320, partial [Candidatus Woesearchaeota archaeon]|nr:hypothetical protein [Candidatus Woesearchaeota archaeon]
MERKKNIAIFMVFLTVFMPIAFAQGTADLEVTKYSGDNGVDGYANPAGNLNIEANAVIDWEDQISNDQVKICLINDNQQIPCRERGNWLNFDSCVEEGDHFKCTFTTPLNIYEDDLKFQVDLY